MRFKAVGASRSERQRRLPGDALVADGAVVATHAVTIDAAPEMVWPWLVQRGGGRAGWYSYDRFDNGGVPSAAEIVPELQQLSVGDVMPALPGATDAFVVADVAETRHLVLGVPTESGSLRVSWCFVLDRLDRGTRLLTRARLGYAIVRLPRVGGVRIPKLLVRLVGSPVHYVMQRKQLLGIRHRAEAMARNEAAPPRRAASDATPREPPGRRWQVSDPHSAEVAPFPRSRRLIVDIGRATRSRRTVQGFLEADVTEVRQRLRDHETATGQEMSFTAYLAGCIGRAVAADRQVHALRDLRGRLVQYDDVDINVSVEVQLEGRSFPMNHVVRAADKRSVPDISAEVHRIKRYPEQSATLRLARPARWFLSLPALLRVWVFRLLYRLPDRQKALGGTVGLTAVGMFGRGGGWGTGFQVHPLEVVVGGIAVKPGYADTEISPREYLHLTLSFDHDIVDGAPAARFASRLRDLIEDPDPLIADTEVPPHPTL